MFDKPTGKRALLPGQVAEFRRAYHATPREITVKEISAITGLSGETIGRMLRGVTYVNIREAEAPKVLAQRAEDSLRLMVEKGFVQNEATGRAMTLEEYDRAKGKEGMAASPLDGGEGEGDDGLESALEKVAKMAENQADVMLRELTPLEKKQRQLFGDRWTDPRHGEGKSEMTDAQKALLKARTGYEV